jgi:cyclopropane fatty-acyl-phospholipid synthase-like methyltransferase
MALTSHEQNVLDYYNRNTEWFYLQGWDSENIHLGIFDESKDKTYRKNPCLIRDDLKQAVLTMTKTIVVPAQITALDVVLDAGCGVGGVAQWMAKEYSCSVIGINICEKQLEIAQKRADEANLLDNVSYQFADCSQELPFADQTFDVVVNIESACHFSKREKFIFECARVLKNCGRIAAQDWVVQEHISREDWDAYIKPLCDAWYLYELETIVSYRTLLESAGFEIVDLEYLENSILPNGYIMQLLYQNLCVFEVTQGPNTNWQEYKEQFRTFYEALFNGHLKILRYLGYKPV